MLYDPLQGCVEVSVLLTILIPSDSNSFLFWFKGSSKTSGSKQQWTKILWSCKETFRMQLGRLLVHILSPVHPSRERKQIFEIVREPNHQEILRDCLSPNLQVSISVFHK